MKERVHRELVVSCDTSHLVKVREAVQEVAGNASFNKTEVAHIVLAVDEAVANIIEHAYEDVEEKGDVHLSMDVDDVRFEIVISDSGKEFKPETIETPDITDHIRMGKKKGLGVFLMRQIMDEVKYTFVQGLRNELRMIKYMCCQEGKK